MKRFLWVNIVLGLWLLAAPFVLGYSASSVAALTNDVVLGILVIGGAWWVIAGLTGGFAAALFEALCGLWLLIAPFVLNISHLPGTLFNEMVVGVIVLVVGLVEAWALVRPPVRAQ